MKRKSAIQGAFDKIFIRRKEYPRFDNFVVIYVGIVLFFQVLLQISPAVTFLAKTPLYSIQTYLGILGGGLIVVDLFTTKRIWQGRYMFFLLAILVFAAWSSTQMRAYGIKENLFKLCWMTIQFCLMYSCAYRIPKEQLEGRIKRLFCVLLTVWCLGCCLSFYQYVNKIGYETLVNPLAKDTSINRQGFFNNRLYGVFYTLNHAAYVSLFFAVIAAVFTLREKRIWAKLLLIFAQIALISYIVLSGSRSALVALAACVLVAVCLGLCYGMKAGGRWKWLLLCVFLVILMAAGCLGYRGIKSGLTLITTRTEKVESTTKQDNILGRTDLEKSTNGRIQIWSDYLSLHKEIGLTGLSPGNYMPYVIQEHQELYLVRTAKFNHQEKYNAGIVYHVHSGYLMVYVSAGALGAVALALFMLLCMIRTIWAIWKSEKANPWFICGLLLVVAGAISALFDEGLFFQNNPQTTMFWLALGLIMSYQYKQNN